MDNIKKYIENNKKETVILFIICMAALILRLVSLIFAGDLWLDEIYSWYFSSKASVFDVVKSLYNEDLHTPLYFILLHFWIKIFGENDTVMRLLGFIPSFLTVPLAFYTGKILFNSKTGYFAAIMLAISPFAIYYSTELRFYGFVLFLSLLSSFLFVKYINSEDSKYKGKFAKALIISNLALLYTFNISFVFIFFQFLCGIFFAKDKKNLLKTYVITGLFYIPGFIITSHGIFAYKNSICSFARDIFIYKAEFISIFLQSFFSGNFFYGTNNNYIYSAYSLKNPNGVFLVLLPVIFCLAGFIRALFSKNKILFMFLTPAVLFLAFEFILASCGLMSLTVRYTLISYGTVVLGCAYGFSLFKFKRLINVLFILYIITVHTFIFAPESPVIKDVEFGTPLKTTLERLDIIQKNDYVLIPVMGKLYRRYLPKEANYLDFEITDMLLNNVVKYYGIIFDSKTTENLTRKNAREILYDYAVSKKTSKQLEKYLKENFKKLKPNDKFIVLVNNMNTVNSMTELYKYPPQKKRELYYKNSFYYILSTKIILDILDISDKNLALEKHFIINDSKHSDNNTGVFVFGKKKAL